MDLNFCKQAVLQVLQRKLTGLKTTDIMQRWGAAYFLYSAINFLPLVLKFTANKYYRVQGAEPCMCSQFDTKTETDTSMDRDTDMDADTDTDKETDDDYQQHQEGGATEYLAPNKWCYKFSAKFCLIFVAPFIRS